MISSPRRPHRRALVAVPGVVALLIATLLTPAPASGRAAAPVTAAWSLAPIPGPDGAPVGVFAPPKLTCPAVDYCSLLTEPRYLTTLAHGVPHTVVAPTYSAGRDETLNGIACSAARDCVAVGVSADRDENDYAGYREELHGTTWLAEAGSQADAAVVCNVEHCVAVGYEDAGIPWTLIDDRDGDGTWVSRQVSTPWRGPGNGAYVEVYTMSCPRTGACVGVGHGLDDQYRDRPLFFYRSGNVWKAVPQALPPGADPYQSQGARRSISCSTDGNCMGLGTYVDADSHHTEVFAEVFRNGVLSAMPVPMPPGSVGQAVAAGAIGCVGPAECAGFARWSGATSHSVLLRYHHAAWSYQLEPTPRGAVPGQTGGAAVACASGAVCVAVGASEVTQGTSTVVRPVAWTWVDGRWTVRVVTAPAGVPADATGTLDSVTCPGPHRCYATGIYGDEAIYGVGDLGVVAAR